MGGSASRPSAAPTPTERQAITPHVAGQPLTRTVEQANCASLLFRSAHPCFPTNIASYILSFLNTHEHGQVAQVNRQGARLVRQPTAWQGSKLEFCRGRWDKVWCVGTRTASVIKVASQLKKEMMCLGQATSRFRSISVLHLGSGGLSCGNDVNSISWVRTASTIIPRVVRTATNLSSLQIAHIRPEPSPGQYRTGADFLVFEVLENIPSTAPLRKLCVEYLAMTGLDNFERAVVETMLRFETTMRCLQLYMFRRSQEHLHSLPAAIHRSHLQELHLAGVREPVLLPLLNSLPASMRRVCLVVESHADGVFEMDGELRRGGFDNVTHLSVLFHKRIGASVLLSKLHPELFPKLESLELSRNLCLAPFHAQAMPVLGDAFVERIHVLRSFPRLCHVSLYTERWIPYAAEGLSGLSSVTLDLHHITSNQTVLSSLLHRCPTLRRVVFWRALVGHVKCDEWQKYPLTELRLAHFRLTQHSGIDLKSLCAWMRLLPDLRVLHISAGRTVVPHFTPVGLVKLLRALPASMQELGLPFPWLLSTSRLPSVDPVKSRLSCVKAPEPESHYNEGEDVASLEWIPDFSPSQPHTLYLLPGTPAFSALPRAMQHLRRLLSHRLFSVHQVCTFDSLGGNLDECIRQQARQPCACPPKHRPSPDLHQLWCTPSAPRVNWVYTHTRECILGEEEEEHGSAGAA